MKGLGLGGICRSCCLALELALVAVLALLCCLVGEGDIADLHVTLWALGEGNFKVVILDVDGVVGMMVHEVLPHGVPSFGAAEQVGTGHGQLSRTCGKLTVKVCGGRLSG